MTTADTTRGRHVVIGVTPNAALSHFGDGLEDALVTSFADAADLPEDVSRVSLLWGEGALPVARTLVDRIAAGEDLTLVIASPLEERVPAASAPGATVGPDDSVDWTVDSLSRRVAELELALDEARADSEALRGRLGTARSRNRRLRGQLDTVDGEAGHDRPAEVLLPRRRRTRALVLAAGALVLAVAITFVAAAAGDFSADAVTGALALGLAVVVLALLGVAVVVLWSAVRALAESIAATRAELAQLGGGLPDLDIRLHANTERIGLLTARLEELGGEQQRALADLRHRVTVAYRTGAGAGPDD